MNDYQDMSVGQLMAEWAIETARQRLQDPLLTHERRQRVQRDLADLEATRGAR